jgi:hypothetical protein
MADHRRRARLHRRRGMTGGTSDGGKGAIERGMEGQSGQLMLSLKLVGNHIKKRTEGVY